MAERTTVVYLGADGVYRRITVSRDETTGEYGVYRQTLWKGKTRAKPVLIHKSKYPIVLEWDGAEESAPKIVQRIVPMAEEVRALICHVTGLTWSGKNAEEQRLPKTIIYGSELAEAILLIGMERYMKIRQHLCSFHEEAVLIEVNPVTYLELKMKVFKALEVYLFEYLAKKEKK